VRNDANKDARQAEITTAGENRWKKVNLHCINQIEVSDTNTRKPGATETTRLPQAVDSSMDRVLTAHRGITRSFSGQPAGIPKRQRVKNLRHAGDLR